MNLKTAPASGFLLSAEAQKKLPVMAVAQLAALQAEKMLPAHEIKSLVALLPGKARGGEMMRSDLEKWLWGTPQTPGVLTPFLETGATFYLGDRVYYLPTTQDVCDAWAASDLGKLIWTPQRFDCDDFAFAFKGHCSRVAYFRGDWKLCGFCLGFVSGLFGWAPGRHAAALFVTYDQGVTEVKFLEPADGTLHTLAECTKIYALFI